MGLIEILILWLVLCALVGAVAKNKNRDGAGWFFMAIVISPLIAGIIVLVMSPGPPAAAALGAMHPGLQTMNVADELTKFAALRDGGTISASEFDAQKTRLLALTAPPVVLPERAQAAMGSRCGNCGKPLGPVWVGGCKHCKRSYADFSPVAVGPS